MHGNSLKTHIGDLSEGDTCTTYLKVEHGVFAHVRLMVLSVRPLWVKEVGKPSQFKMHPNKVVWDVRKKKTELCCRNK